MTPKQQTRLVNGLSGLGFLLGGGLGFGLVFLALSGVRDVPYWELAVRFLLPAGVLSGLPALVVFLFPPSCPQCGFRLKKIGRRTVMWKCERCGHFEDTGVTGRAPFIRARR